MCCEVPERVIQANKTAKNKAKNAKNASIRLALNNNVPKLLRDATKCGTGSYGSVTAYKNLYGMGVKQWEKLVFFQYNNGTISVCWYAQDWVDALEEIAKEADRSQQAAMRKTQAINRDTQFHNNQPYEVVG
jgi:hypothetical protein